MWISFLDVISGMFIRKVFMGRNDNLVDDRVGIWIGGLVIFLLNVEKFFWCVDGAANTRT